MKKNNDISPETQDEAAAIAKQTQKPGQTKEQTRLISLGIQKGIAEYKKQVKGKQREADKAKKKNQKNADQRASEKPLVPENVTKKSTLLPWSLLLISWLGFAAYLYQSNIF